MRVISLIISLALALVAFSMPISESVEHGEPSTSGAPSALGPQNPDVNGSGAFLKSAEEIAEAAKGSSATGALEQLPAAKGAPAANEKPSTGLSGGAGGLGAAPAGKPLGTRNTPTGATQDSAVVAAAEGAAKAAANQVASVQGVDRAAGAASQSKP